MSPTPIPKEPFRARDDQGTQFEVTVFVAVTTIPHFEGTTDLEEFSHAEAKVLSGPLTGQTFQVIRIEGDTFQGPGFKLTRVR